MAEGHRQNGIFFSYNNKETKLHEITKRYIKDVFGVEAKIRRESPHPTVTTVVCNLKEVEAYILNFYNGENATTKRMSDFVMKWDPEMQLALLIGWLKGDGGLEETKIAKNPDAKFERQGSRSKYKLLGTTASFDLAVQMYNIALRCGLHPCFKKRITKRNPPLKNNRMETVSYDVYFTMKKDIERIYGITIPGRNCGRRFHTGSHMITPINKITSELYTGNMYDLTTKKGNFWGGGEC